MGMAEGSIGMTEVCGQLSLECVIGQNYEISELCVGVKIIKVANSR